MSQQHPSLIPLCYIWMPIKTNKFPLSSSRGVTDYSINMSAAKIVNLYQSKLLPKEDQTTTSSSTIHNEHVFQTQFRRHKTYLIPCHFGFHKKTKVGFLSFTNRQRDQTARGFPSPRHFQLRTIMMLGGAVPQPSPKVLQWA
jgi:hypothetical protein